MYKTRIKQWGLDKKNKENEMRAIVRKSKHVRDQGKPPSFHVRGRSIDYKDVVRYWERKGLRIEDVIAQRSESKTPETVDCFVPVSSPSMSLEPTTKLECILISIRDYFNGSFHAGTWLAKDSQTGCRTTENQDDGLGLLYAMFEQSQTACRLFAKKSLSGSRTNINLCQC